MTQDTNKSLLIQQTTGLKPLHFADLVRIAQLVVDPARGLSGRLVQVDWQALGIPPAVVENLQALGERYRYASPHMPIEVIWKQLSPETRNWLFEHKKDLWRIEEMFPALDED